MAGEKMQGSDGVERTLAPSLEIRYEHGQRFLYLDGEPFGYMTKGELRFEPVEHTHWQIAYVPVIVGEVFTTEGARANSAD